MLTNQSIQRVTFATPAIVRRTAMFFAGGSAQSAVFAGGFYTVVTLSSSNALELREFDNALNLVRTVALGISGTALGITGTPSFPSSFSWSFSGVLPQLISKVAIVLPLNFP